jgi:hypothetical protein
MDPMVNLVGSLRLLAADGRWCGSRRRLLSRAWVRVSHDDQGTKVKQIGRASVIASSKVWGVMKQPCAT